MPYHLTVLPQHPRFDLDKLRAAHDLRIEFPFLDKPARIDGGEYLQTLCPFHVRVKGTPSLLVFKDHWKCMSSCGNSGDVISLVQWQHNLTFIEACIYLQAHTTLSLGTLKQSEEKFAAPVKEAGPMDWEILNQLEETTEENSQQLLAMGLSLPALAFGNVRVISAHFYAFPVWSGETLLDIQVYHPGGEPKWKPMEPGHGKHLYNADYVSDKEEVWICEGPKNTLAALGIGLFACGTLGAGVWKDSFDDLLSSARFILTLGDYDAAGALLGQKVRGHLARAAEFRWSWLGRDLPPRYDIADFVRDGGDQQTLRACIPPLIF